MKKEKSSGAIRARDMSVKTEAWMEAAYDKKLNRKYYIKAQGSQHPEHMKAMK